MVCFGSYLNSKANPFAFVSEPLNTASSCPKAKDIANLARRNIQLCFDIPASVDSSSDRIEFAEAKFIHQSLCNRISAGFSDCSKQRVSPSSISIDLQDI